MLLEMGDAQAVDEHMIVLADLGDRTAHGQVGGVIDVQAIDLGHRGGADADRDGPAPYDRGETLALLCGQRLRVAHARDTPSARRHDHGCRDDGTTRGRDADLVDTDDSLGPCGPKDTLPPDGRGDRAQRLASAPAGGVVGWRDCAIHVERV